MSELITVAKVLHPAEAESIRLLLQSHEIPVVLQGENTGTALSYLGSAVGTRVCVPHEFADRAQQIIASQDRRRSGATEQGAWYCGPCREEVDAGFETCWSCGQPREEVERPFPQDRKTAAEESPSAVTNSRRESADDTVRRAWRTAVLGFGLFPFISHVYSVAVLAEAVGQWDSLSEKSRQLFVRTMIVDVIAILGFGVAFSLMFGGRR
jgi:hypothetical protein